MSLNNLSHPARRGRPPRRRAWPPSRKPSSIRRRLAAPEPAAYEPDLAMALNNLSNRLAEAGRRDDALAAIEEAVEIRRRLAAANPAAYEPDLAMALNNLSTGWPRPGRRERRPGRQRGSRRRSTGGWPRQNPAAYEPDLAMALNNLSIRLAEAGPPRRRPGRQSRKPSTIHRRLAAPEPGRLRTRPRHGAEQPVDPAGRGRPPRRRPGRHRGSRRRSAAGWPTPNPAAYEPDLATALNNLSIRLAEAGRRADGLAASRGSRRDLPPAGRARTRPPTNPTSPRR